MKKMLTMMVAAVLTTSLFAGIGATQEWVQKYVAQAISNSTATISANTKDVTTNDVTVVSTGTDEVPIIMTITEANVPAIQAANCSAAAVAMGVTNGVLWAWDEANDRYKNKNLNPIVPTATNFVWGVYHSGTDDNANIVMLDGSNTLFKILTYKITDAEARQVKGE